MNKCYVDIPKHPAIKSAGELRIKGTNIYIDVIRDWSKTDKSYRMYTDDLKYENKMRIIWDSNSNCYTVAGLKSARDKWNKDHNIKEPNPFEEFLELTEEDEYEMSNL